jgi:hypothetical protein
MDALLRPQEGNMDGEIRAIAPETFDPPEAGWHTICRTVRDVTPAQRVAFAWFDSEGERRASAEAHGDATHRWTFGVACGHACTREVELTLLRSIAAAVRGRGARAIETAIGYDSALPFDLFHEAGLPVASLLSYGGESALVLLIGDEPRRQQQSTGPRSARTSSAKSTTIGR